MSPTTGSISYRLRRAAFSGVRTRPRTSCPALRRAAALIADHGELDDGIASAARLLDEAVINCDEAATELRAALTTMDLSPERLAELERRIGRQYDLARKHRVQPDQLEGVLERLGDRLERSATIEKRLARIDGELESALVAYRDAAMGLHRKRAERAATLSASVTQLMQELGMAGGRFELEARHEPERAPSARGDTHVTINVSANGGTAPGPLARVASGGELGDADGEADRRSVALGRGHFGADPGDPLPGCCDPAAGARNRPAPDRPRGPRR